MPIANNILTGGILAPFITILAGVSLATLQRSIEWISSIAKTPQKYVQTIQITPFSLLTLVNDTIDVTLISATYHIFDYRGYLRQIKPFIKNVDSVLERVLAGSKFTVTATNVLLMGIMIILICLILEGAEKPPKRVVVVENKKKQ